MDRGMTDTDMQPKAPLQTLVTPMTSPMDPPPMNTMEKSAMADAVGPESSPMNVNMAEKPSDSLKIELRICDDDGESPVKELNIQDQ